MQLEMRLNEIRNQELKTLTQYQASKLNQFDECLRKAEIETDENELIEVEKILESINKCQTLKIEENMSVDIKGCLKTNMNGMFFSFENLVLKERKN